LTSALPPRPSLFPYTTLFRSLVYMFFQVPDWGTELRERHRFNLDILRAAKRLGVDFAFPTQTLYMERGPGAAQPSDEPFTARERSEEHTSELQSRENLVCRLL